MAELLFSGTWLADVRDLGRLEVAAPRLVITAAGAGAVQFRATRVICERGLDWLRSRLAPCGGSVQLWDSVEHFTRRWRVSSRKETTRMRNGCRYYKGRGALAATAAYVCEDVCELGVVGAGRRQEWEWSPPRADCGGLSSIHIQFDAYGNLRCLKLMCCSLENGQLHSSGDGVARILLFEQTCEFEWYAHNRRHRAGGRPALIGSSGVNGWEREWWVHGERHRGGGLPAVEHADGSREWWVHGERHRGGGLPAVEYADGSREWWVHDQRHRGDDGGGVPLPLVVSAIGDAYFGNERKDGGPTVVRANGTREWYDGAEGGLPTRVYGFGGGVRLVAGRLARAGLPARELPDGTCEWYNARGVQTRIKRPDGTLKFFNEQGEELPRADKSTDPGGYAAMKRMKRKAVKDTKKAKAAAGAAAAGAGAAAVGAGAAAVGAGAAAAGAKGAGPAAP